MLGAVDKASREILLRESLFNHQTAVRFCRGLFLLHCHSVFLISNIGQVPEKGEVQAVDTLHDRSLKQT